MHDKMYEAKITELEQEVQKWKEGHEHLKRDNIILANELVNRQNLIDTYESVFMKKDDSNEQ